MPPSFPALPAAASRATLVAFLLAAPLGGAAGAAGFDPALSRFVDLTHSFGYDTVYWPTAPSGFGYMPLTAGRTAGGWYYSAGAFSAPEHGGTHLDAPIHFHEGGKTADQIPLTSLIAPVVVIDAGSQAAMSSDYEVSTSDLTVHEARFGPVPRGSIALVRTGWSSKWPDKSQYLGDDTPGETANLHFPGFSEELMKVLVEQRGVVAVGIDTASLDPGNSTEFKAHRVAAAAGVPGFENLANLDKLPGKGAWLFALPMKIAGGSGGPLRAVAVVPPGF